MIAADERDYLARELRYALARIYSRYNVMRSPLSPRIVVSPMAVLFEANDKRGSMGSRGVCAALRAEMLRIVLLSSSGSDGSAARGALKSLHMPHHFSREVPTSLQRPADPAGMRRVPTGERPLSSPPHRPCHLTTIVDPAVYIRPARSLDSGRVHARLRCSWKNGP